MKQTIMTKLGMVALASGVVAACQTTEVALLDSATPFTRSELYTYLADTTQSRSGDAVFYSSEGTADILQDGERFEGSWGSTKDGAVCLYVKAWGDHVPCETYYHNGDEVSVVADGATMAAPRQYEGNAVDAVRDNVAYTPPEEQFEAGFEPTPFTTDETIAFLSDKSVIWAGNGGAYYAPDFTLKTVWDGARANGTWSVNDEGAVCWQIAAWGTTPCEGFFLYKDELWSIYKGEYARADEYVEGDQTAGM